MKKTLQEICLPRLLLTAHEAIIKLGWLYTVDRETGRPRDPCICSCGTQIKTGGWVGVEHAWCPNCGKGMQDVTGLLPAGTNTATHVDYDNVIMPNDGRVWIAENVWGLT